MKIVGYHGTNKKQAKSILKNNRFYYSTRDDEWLGDGIYFYVRAKDAYTWAKKKYGDNAVVLSAIIIIDGKLIDLETKKGRQIIEEKKKQLVYEYNVKRSNIEKNQCTLMNFIWNEEKCKAIIGLFPMERSIFPTLSDGRPRRREFCIRDRKMIKSVYFEEIK